MALKDTIKHMTKVHGKGLCIAIRYMAMALIPSSHKIVKALQGVCENTDNFDEHRIILAEPSISLSDVYRLEEMFEILEEEIDAGFLKQLIQVGDDKKTIEKLTIERLKIDKDFQHLAERFILIHSNMDYLHAQIEESLYSQQIQIEASQEIRFLFNYLVGQVVPLVKEADMDARIPDLSWLQEGVYKIEEGFFNDAIELFSKYHEKEPGWATPLIGLTTAYATLLRWDKALDALTKAKNVRPDDKDLAHTYTRLAEYIDEASQYQTMIFSVSPLLRVGDKLEEWSIVKSIDFTNVSQVYQIEKEDSQAFLKIIYPRTRQDLSLLELFQEDMILLSQLSPHKNLVQVLQSGRLPNAWYIITDYIQGPNLSRYLKQHGAVTDKNVVAIGIQLVEGLQHLYSTGILHRNITPKTVAFRNRSTVALTDLQFHYAKKDEQSLLFTASEFMNDNKASQQSDFYALAAVLYYALYYDPKDEPKPYSPKYQNMSKSWKKFFQTNLNPQPEKRAQSIEELKQQLKEVQEQITHI